MDVQGDQDVQDDQDDQDVRDDQGVRDARGVQEVACSSEGPGTVGRTGCRSGCVVARSVSIVLGTPSELSVVVVPENKH